jgi:hypothetical protein
MIGIVPEDIYPASVVNGLFYKGDVKIFHDSWGNIIVRRKINRFSILS